MAGSGLGLLEKVSIKAELYDRKRISGAAAGVTPTPRPGMQATRTMQATAERPRGRTLRDAKTGEPVTLKFSPA